MTKKNMTRRTALALCCAGLLTVPAFAGKDGAKTPACCKKPSGAAASDKAMSGKMRCTLTGKEVDKCCCEMREGKLYCPLAKKTVEKCCCEPVKAKDSAA